MNERSPVAIEFTEEELERILMALTLARNSHSMRGTEIDALIEKVVAHTGGTAETIVNDHFEELRSDSCRDD